jgi:hypothetical protein
MRSIESTRGGGELSADKKRKSKIKKFEHKYGSSGADASRSELYRRREQGRKNGEFVVAEALIDAGVDIAEIPSPEELSKYQEQARLDKLVAQEAKQQKATEKNKLQEQIRKEQAQTDEVAGQILEAEQYLEHEGSEKIPQMKDIQILDFSTGGYDLGFALRETGIGNEEKKSQGAGNLESIKQKLYKLISEGKKIDVIVLGEELAANRGEEGSDGWKTSESTDKFMEYLFDLHEDLLHDKAAGRGDDYDLLKDAKVIVTTEAWSDRLEELEGLEERKGMDEKKLIVGEIQKGSPEEMADAIKVLLKEKGLAQEEESEE